MSKKEKIRRKRIKKTIKKFESIEKLYSDFEKYPD